MVLLWLHNAIRFSSIFLFGATGETITEKSGHLNLGIPGIMCLGALGGIFGEAIYIKGLGDYTTMNGFVAVLIPILFALLFAGLGGLLYGFLTITLRCNQNVSGLAITTFGMGVTNFFGGIIMKPDVVKEGLSYAGQFFIKHIAVKSGWFSDLFLTYGCLVYIALAIAVLAAIILKKTRLGLNLRAIGESPATADAAGVNVNAYKYSACVLGAAIAGLGGLFYIMDYNSGNWEYDISAFGWLAVALVIFSLWRPQWGILGSIVFGALYFAPIYMKKLITISPAGQELITALPYVVTVVILIIISIFNKRETQPPAALGLSYFREDR